MWIWLEKWVELSFRTEAHFVVKIRLLRKLAFLGSLSPKEYLRTAYDGHSQPVTLFRCTRDAYKRGLLAKVSPPHTVFFFLLRYLLTFDSHLWGDLHS